MLDIEEIAKTVHVIGDEKLMMMLNDTANAEGFQGYCDTSEVISYSMKLATEKVP